MGKQCNKFENHPYLQCPEETVTYSKCSIYVVKNSPSNQFMFVQNINTGGIDLSLYPNIEPLQPGSLLLFLTPLQELLDCDLFYAWSSFKTFHS